MRKIIITIDGWSSCGKSTLAKQLAKTLHYVYIDSGAMYRAITLYFLRNMVDWTKEKQVTDALKNIELAFIPNEKSGEAEIYLNGENVVFPKAELKIFMTADNAIRVERRFRELYAKNPNITIEEVKNNLEMRDYIDSHREISPLKKAEDAVILDNSNITPEQQLEMVLGLVKQKI